MNKEMSQPIERLFKNFPIMLTFFQYVRIIGIRMSLTCKMLREAILKTRHEIL